MWTRRILDTLAPYFSSPNKIDCYKPTLRERLIKIGRDPKIVEVPRLFCCAIDYEIMDHPVIVDPVEGHAIDARVIPKLDEHDHAFTPFNRQPITPIKQEHLCDFNLQEQIDLKDCLVYYLCSLRQKIVAYQTMGQLTKDQLKTLEKNTRMEQKIEQLYLNITTGQLANFHYHDFTISHLRKLAVAIRVVFNDESHQHHPVLAAAIRELIPRRAQIKVELMDKINDLIRHQLGMKLQQQQEDYISALERIHELRKDIEEYSAPINLKSTLDEMELDRNESEAFLADQEKEKNEKLMTLKILLLNEYISYITTTKKIIRSVYKRNRQEKKQENKDTLARDIDEFNKLQDELGWKDKRIEFKLDSDEEVSMWEEWPGVTTSLPPEQPQRAALPQLPPQEPAPTVNRGIRLGMFPHVNYAVSMLPTGLFYRQFSMPMRALPVAETNSTRIPSFTDLD